MVEGMKMMTGWHRDAFSVFPVGSGSDIKVDEFDYARRLLSGGWKYAA